MDPVKVRNEVRASILWGEPAASVRDEHLKKGVPAHVVEAALREALKERDSHFKKSGLMDLLYAALCAAGAAVAIMTFLAIKKSQGQVSRYRGLAGLMLAVVGLPVASAFFLLRGIVRLCRGGAGEGAASDVKKGD